MDLTFGRAHRSKHHEKRQQIRGTGPRKKKYQCIIVSLKICDFSWVQGEIVAWQKLRLKL